MREILYRVLPESWVPYFLHTRPRAWPIVTAHMSIGFLLANGLYFGEGQLGRWLLAALAWGVLGNGGTLAINSAYDRDEGDIGYLENPPAVPNHLALFSMILLLLGFVPAAFLGWNFVISYAICFVMSLLYSVPPFRLKARAGWDVIINSFGFGALTIYAGWAAMRPSIESPITLVSTAFFFFFMGFYPLTQIYQFEEDSRRGDYTLALALGKTRALLLAIACVGLGFVFLGIEVFHHFAAPRALGIALALAAWLLVLMPWYAKRNQVDWRYEQKGFYNALYAWALTDVAVAVAMMPIWYS